MTETAKIKKFDVT